MNQNTNNTQTIENVCEFLNEQMQFFEQTAEVQRAIDNLMKDGKVRFMVRITDNGIGMSEEFMEKMFDPFAQEKYDARSFYQGNGLGMPIVKSLVKRMGGTPDWTIWILCVTFTLIWARIAAVFANKATPKTLNRVTGVILVILGIAVWVFSILSK